MRIADGYQGWQDQAPFDRIIVTAATNMIPPALIEQLEPDGRLIMPIGQVHAEQALTLVHKITGNKVEEKSILPVVFVPLTRH